MPWATRQQTSTAALLTLLLILAAVLRVLDFPSRYAVRSVDEMPYLQGSLELLEGLTPAYKYAPAGPLTWLGWAYSGSQAMRYMVHPTTEELAVPFQIRPYVAVNHALFDNYRDLSGLRRFIVIISVALSMLAVAAAFGAGLRASGRWGAILCGGIVAVAPLMVSNAEQARSFSMGWSLAIIAVFFALCFSGRKAVLMSAICMGLAIGSRVDMLGLLPIVWLICWKKEPAHRAALLAVLRHGMITALSTLLIAPWLLTNLIGNLRTIATVRFSPPPVPIPVSIALREFAWQQGLGPIAVLFIVCLVLGLITRRIRFVLVCLFAALLLPALAKSTGHGIEHQAPTILALFIAAPLALTALQDRPRLTATLVFLCLLLPLAVTIEQIRADRAWVPDDATAWVETHIPSGTILYIYAGFHDPLPTPQSADALWQEEMMNDAAKKKFQSGLTRFHLTDLDIPRALSEENMIVERVYRRGWYILGSRAFLPDRRYDIRLYEGSMVFGLHDPTQEYLRTGGVIIWRDSPNLAMGTPLMQWIDSNGHGTYIYCSDDIRHELVNPPKSAATQN